MDYKPKNFNMDKMNAFKILYIYRRKQEIFSELLSQIDMSDPQSYLRGKPMLKSYEYVQQETGMSDEDLSEALSIGLWIDEYDQMIKMNDEDLQVYIDDIEQDYEVPPELEEELKELHENISQMIQKKQKERDLFKQICDDNFNTEN